MLCYETYKRSYKKKMYIHNCVFIISFLFFLSALMINTTYTTKGILLIVSLFIFSFGLKKRQDNYYDPSDLRSLSTEALYQTI